MKVTSVDRVRAGWVVVRGVLAESKRWEGPKGFACVRLCVRTCVVRGVTKRVSSRRKHRCKGPYAPG